MRRAKRGDTYDLESLVQFRVFPQDLGLSLRKSRMVLVRIDLENSDGHACSSSVLRGVFGSRVGRACHMISSATHLPASCSPQAARLSFLVDNNNNNCYYYYHFVISVNSASGGGW